MPDVVLLPGQQRLWESTSAHILFVAGVGSGKTEGGARWSFKQVVEQPYATGFIGAPSYDQLQKATLPAFFALLQQLGIEYHYNKRPPAEWGMSRFEDHDGIISIRLPGVTQPVQVDTGTLDNPEAHRGKKFGWAWLDESRDIKEKAYDIILSRLRGQPEGTVYRTLNTTTPNGFGWLHKRFIVNPAPGSEVIRAKTTENPYLPAGFIENLRAQYTEQFARQELEGEFLNMAAGQAYYSFSRIKHVSAVVIDPMLPMFYTADFNVSPLCAVFGQADKVSCRFSGDIYIQGSGRTADAAEEFLRRHKEHKNKTLVVYGDMSGASASTRSDSTDYDILSRVFQAGGWAVEIRRNYSNPPLVESVEAVNATFEHGRATVDPACKHLIQDLEQVAWQEGTRILDKKNKELTHCSDAARYFIFKEFSPKQKASSSDLLN